MGGSSVGAIVALLAYSCGGRLEAKSEKLAAIVGDMNLGEMVDGNLFARNLSKLLGKKDAVLRPVRTAIGALLTLPTILDKLGINPVEKLYNWISSRLNENGVYTLDDLQKLIETLPNGLSDRETGAAITDYDTSLRIVVADITTSTKVVFPEMAEMYWQEPRYINPACFARASASIPLFFQPFIVDGISHIIEKSEKWERLGSFTGTLPNKVSFADGGLLSNFPIDLFERHGVPRAPTFGARLGSNMRSSQEIDRLEQYARQLFDTFRHYADYDFIFKNPLYKHLITHINTDKYNWLDFSMSFEDKLALFREGVLAGYGFLECFDWAKYKKLRSSERANYHLHTKPAKCY
jgi:NTE family protein